MKQLAIIILLFLIFAQSQAQDFIYDAGMWNITDNREYANQRDRSKTYFGTQTWAEVGFRVDSIHSFVVGANYFYEFGSHNPLQYVFPVMYYHAKYKGVDLYAGAFERKNKFKYPLALLSDTVSYFRPNIEGLLLSHTNKNGHHNLWIDWTSRQSFVHRETFLVGISGQQHWGNFYASHYAILYHFAGTVNPPPDHSLRDNAAVNVNVGYNFSSFVPLDSLSFSIGSLTGLDRTRSEGDDWNTPSGLLLQANAAYKFVGTEWLAYFGPGMDVMMGDALYLAGNYGRADFYFVPFHNERIRTRLVFSWHYHQGDIKSTQQALSIDISLKPRSYTYKTY
jgi:hypothetical protein